MGVLINILEILTSFKEYLFEIWPNLKWNVISEFLGLILEVAIVSFIVDRIIKKRDKEHEIKKWEPVRKHLVKYIFESYRSLFLAALYAVHYPASLPKLETRNHHLKGAEKKLYDLKKQIDFNNVALDSFLANNIYKYVEDYESYLDRIRYQLKLFDPEYAHIDLVSQPLYMELTRIKRIIEELEDRYDLDSLKSPSEIHQIPSLESIKKNWGKIAEETDRLCLYPKNYKYRTGQTPMLYDILDLHFFSGNNNKRKGKSFEIFHTFEGPYLPRTK